MILWKFPIMILKLIFLSSWKRPLRCKSLWIHRVQFKHDELISLLHRIVRPWTRWDYSQVSGLPITWWISVGWQQTGSKPRKEYDKYVYCHPAYLTYMQSTSWEMLGWMKHKLESRLRGEISATSDMLMTSLVAQTVKRLPTMQETRIQTLGWEDLLEKEMATHSSTLAWKIPWMEEPGRL